jgi:hypothetical protein
LDILVEISRFGSLSTLDSQCRAGRPGWPLRFLHYFTLLRRKVEAALNENLVAKAEGWLLNVANDMEGVWDQEALVYLRSRGHDCHDQVADLIQAWKVAEQARLDEYNQRVEKPRGAEANATNIEAISPNFLRDFWGGAQPEDYSFEATMLRTVDWCEIAGFDSWWHRLEQRLKENTFSHEGTNLLPNWLFAMARSDYAIKAMRRVLERHLELISISGPNKPEPWMVRTSTTSVCVEQHLSHASAIVFAHHRLNLVHSDPELVQQAVDTLCKMQDGNGAWHNFSSDADASIESTAMAVHAIALAQPGSWPRIAERARDWLGSVQQDDGSWTEPGSPGPTYLTALVLDAIALANGDKTVTFRWPTAPPEHGETVVGAEVAERQGPRTALKVTDWADIEISFLSDFRVQFRCGQQTETCNCKELGFEDSRNGKPKRAWLLLRYLAESEGTIRNEKEIQLPWRKVEKGVQEIRGFLRQYFGIPGDPLRFAEGNGYRTVFRIVRAPSYDT